MFGYNHIMTKMVYHSFLNSIILETIKMHVDTENEFNQLTVNKFIPHSTSQLNT